jgi:5-methylcytosine-specific restriction endonuclease McrA
MKKKRILSDEHKRKIAESLKGRKKILSAEAIENIRKAAAKRKGIPTGPLPEETKEKIRIATTGKAKNNVRDNNSWFKKGHIPICPFKKGNKPWNVGIPLSEKMRAHLSNILKGRKHSAEEIEKRRRSLTKNWDEYAKYDRHCAAHRRWSKEVRTRDNFICQNCFINDKKMHAHHIKSWKDYPMLRFDINNGMTLCISCHNKIHKNDVRNGWNKGKKWSDEMRKKLSESHKGKIPWNKGFKKITVV